MEKQEFLAEVLSHEYVDLLHELADHFAVHGGVTLPLQILKIQEELGEATAAYIGAIGANPRKGIYASMDDVVDELADVIITAMIAILMAGYGVNSSLVHQANKTIDRLREFQQQDAPVRPAISEMLVARVRLPANHTDLRHP